jgi:coenzyme F420-dependent glucose-6-phosphate dehydrogenase
LKIGLDYSFWIDPDYSLEMLSFSEKAGFDSVWFGDHFLPWHHSFKHSCCVWPVMAAAAERTERIPVGVDVTVPIGGRYHPAIIAQAVSTLEAMYPGRILLGVGNGEAMNEKRFMSHWPKWKERMERLTEALDFIRRLWTEEDFFDFHGKYFAMDKAFLYVKPRRSIPIYFSAIGEKAAFYAGMYGDHLITVNTQEKCRDVIFPQFEKGALAAGKDVKRMQKVVSVIGGVVDIPGAVRRIRKLHAGSMIMANFEEEDPRKIEQSQSQVTDEMIFQNYCLSKGGEELIEAFDSFRKIGTNQVIFTDFSPDPKETIRVFRRKVIPYFKRK